MHTIEKNTKSQNHKSATNLGIIDILVLDLSRNRQPLKSTFTSMITAGKASRCSHNQELDQTLSPVWLFCES